MRPAGDSMSRLRADKDGGSEGGIEDDWGTPNAKGNIVDPIKNWISASPNAFTNHSNIQFLNI
jgi:hypothetical protein